MDCSEVVLLMINGVCGYLKEDLVVRLPGQPKFGFKQYAGYVDVDKQSGRSLFYYFVEADKDAHNHPLTLQLNGGPGCSSVGGGAFTELGPFFPTGDGRGLRINSKSWNKASNLLFVESPAGVGWSYSNTTSDYTRGDDLTEGYVPEYAETIRRLQATARKEVLPMPGMGTEELANPQNLLAEGLIDRAEAIEAAEKVCPSGYNISMRYNMDTTIELMLEIMDGSSIMPCPPLMF